MHKWTKAASSAVLMMLGGFLIFYAYYMWISQHEFEFLGFRLAPLEQLLYIYYVVGSISFVLGLILAYKKVNTELSKLARATFLVSLMVFSSYLIYEAYHTSIWPWYYRWQPFYYVAGLTLFATGLIVVYKALKTEINKSTSASIILAMLIITGSFLFYDAYRISANYHQALNFLLKHPVPVQVARSFEPLFTAYQWLPLYTAFALIPIASGIIIINKALSTQTRNLANGMFLGGLMVFGSYLIYEAYHNMIWPRYQWLPLYYVVGFISFTIGLIIAYKALNTQKFKLASRIVSAIQIIIGSFLIYDAYNIALGYYQIFSNHVPASLLTPYQWLPLYVAVAVASITAGLIIVYKTFKFQTEVRA